MHVMLAAVTLALLGTNEVSQAEDWGDRDRRFEVTTGLALGARPDAASFGAAGPTFGGVGMLGLSYGVFTFLRPELVLGFGAYDGPVDLVTVIRIGARLELPLTIPLTPFLSVAFAHDHAVSIAAAQAHPVESVLGLSETGVSHRSGVELGLGTSWDMVRWREGHLGLRLLVRATVALLLGTGPQYGGLQMGCGVTF